MIQCELKTRILHRKLLNSRFRSRQLLLCALSLSLDHHQGAFDAVIIVLGYGEQCLGEVVASHFLVQASNEVFCVYAIFHGHDDCKVVRQGLQ